MGQKIILLADDNCAHTQLIGKALEQVDCACRLDVVCDGTEVIDYLFGTGSYADHDPKQMPDLILLDLQMPKMSGIQVLQVLRRVRSECLARIPPVVILTTSARPADVADAYRFGTYSYVRKPADYGRLVETIRQVINYWLGLNEFPPAEPPGEDKERTSPGKPAFLRQKTISA